MSTNRFYKTDDWGGTLEERVCARLVQQIVLSTVESPLDSAPWIARYRYGRMAWLVSMDKDTSLLQVTRRIVGLSVERSYSPQRAHRGSSYANVTTVDPPHRFEQCQYSILYIYMSSCLTHMTYECGWCWSLGDSNLVERGPYSVVSIRGR
jgi:hypothetical protein